jgi:hypothetical protein
MSSSAVVLALIAVSSAPAHLGVAGDPRSLVGLTAAVLRDRARYVGARLRTKASSAS